MDEKFSISAKRNPNVNFTTTLSLCLLMFSTANVYAAEKVDAANTSSTHINASPIQSLIPLPVQAIVPPTINFSKRADHIFEHIIDESNVYYLEENSSENNTGINWYSTNLFRVMMYTKDSNNLPIKWKNIDININTTKTEYTQIGDNWIINSNYKLTKEHANDLKNQQLKNLQKDISFSIACVVDAFGHNVEFEACQAVAMQGDALAQYRLGVCYQKEIGVEKNEVEAYKYYTLAADQGHANGQCSLGWCYENGRGVTQSFTEAARYFKLAADQGHAGAQFNLAVCYANGEGVTQSFTEAARYFKLAADQGHAGAQFNLAVCYANGEGVTQSFTEAIKYYTLAADQGHAGAQCSLGWCYEHGKGVEQNLTEAVKHYTLAADQGDAGAQFNLGICYQKKIGVEQSFTEAARYYKLAADQGQADAQCSLGWCYVFGKGVTQSFTEAVKYYKLSADQGQADAQCNLGGVLCIWKRRYTEFHGSG